MKENIIGYEEIFHSNGILKLERLINEYLNNDEWYIDDNLKLRNPLEDLTTNELFNEYYKVFKINKFKYIFCRRVYAKD